MFSRMRLLLLTLVALGGALAGVPAASAAPGDLDPSFGSGGVARILASQEESIIRGVAVQPDGKIVLAGGEVPGNVLLVRLLPNGSMDPSFGQGGKVVTAIPGGFSGAQAVAIQPDGKIVVVGSAKGTVNEDFLFARYNTDGSPDLGFGGGDGFTILPIGAEADRAEAVAIGSDGKIVATGEAGLPSSDRAAGVAVVLANGMPDPGFAGGGSILLKTTPKYDQGAAVAVLADGRILIADSSGAGGGQGFTLFQLLPSSAPDPSFGGGDGVVETPIPIGGAMGSAGRVTDLALLADGRIVASGYGFDYVGTPPTYDSKVVVVEYRADGELEPSFGDGGIFTKQLGVGEDSARTIAVAEGGRLLLAGEHEDSAKKNAPAVLRLDPGGALDPSFGDGGLVLRDQTALFGEGVNGAAVDGEDRLVTVGTAYLGGGKTEISVTRYLGDPRPVVANRAPHARMKKVPRKVKAGKLKGFSGTASDPDGDALSRVQIALVKRVPGGAKASRRAAKSCFVLKNAKARFKKLTPKKGRRCPQHWLAVKGTAKWRFKLKASLPPGSYVVYSRAVDDQGLAESSFSRKAGDRYAFRVLGSR